ncbi:MAG: RcpC/CpaB family pilus assembly protein, partial [Sphingopyxis sp.]|nr:RcpC/CpaB family pilus assembly protein [Sphingopyxis sp.]
ILLTLEIEDEQGGGAELHTTETIVRNLRVLAVDQRSTPMDENGNSTPVLYGNVTLEATPQMAEKIAVARSVGTLSLSLRSLTDSAAELEEAIATGAVSVPRDGDARGEARMLGGANSRPTDRGVTSVTGGDVSRYLRRGLPPRRALPVPAAPSYQPSYTPPSGRAPASPAVPTDSGPSVRIIRGAQQPTIVPVGR